MSILCKFRAAVESTALVLLLRRHDVGGRLVEEWTGQPCCALRRRQLALQAVVFVANGDLSSCYSTRSFHRRPLGVSTWTAQTCASLVYLLISNSGCI